MNRELFPYQDGGVHQSTSAVPRAEHSGLIGALHAKAGLTALIGVTLSGSYFAAPSPVSFQVIRGADIAIAPPGIAVRRQFAEGHRASISSRPASSEASYRLRELHWASSHPDYVAQNVGKWVVLDGERVVASGNDAKGVYDQAKAMGIEVPFLLLLSPEGGGVAKLGL